MSLFDYQTSKRIAAIEPSTFYSLLMAAMRCADSYNAVILRRAFPEVYEELQARFNAPGGCLPGELTLDEEVPFYPPLFYEYRTRS